MNKFIIILLILPFNIKAQIDSILIHTYYDGVKHFAHRNILYEKYFATTTTDSTRHGAYKQYSKSGRLVISGHYKNGKRNGKWNYYSSKVDTTLLLRFDWDNFKELYFFNDSTNVKYADIKTNGSFNIQKVDVSAHFPGGIVILHNYIQLKLQKLQIDPRLNDRSIKIYVFFVVDAYGQTRVNECSGGSMLTASMRKFIIQVFENMPKWNPAVLNGRSVESKMTIPINIKAPNKM